MEANNEAEEILLRVESKSRSFRGAFCVAMVGIVTLVAARMTLRAPDIIRTKTMAVIDGKDVLATVASYNHKAVLGTLRGGQNLVGIGEGQSGGVLTVTAASDKAVIR